MDLLSNYKQNQPIIFIEGYSFGSKGQGVFQIAENCGILKYRLLEEEYGIAPGQACVFYAKNKLGYKVLGGGWIVN